MCKHKLALTLCACVYKTWVQLGVTVYMFTAKCYNWLFTVSHSTLGEHRVSCFGLVCVFESLMGMMYM